MQRIFFALALLSQLSCNSMREARPLCVSELRHSRIAQEELVVLPVFGESRTSGFPVSPRTAIGAAHALDPDACIPNGAWGFVAARGYPMMAGMYASAEESRRSMTDDWMIMLCSKDRFEANCIDVGVELRRNDLVFIGGYFSQGVPNRAARFISSQPSIISGRVINRVSRMKGARQLIHISVPIKDYRGFSGGPLAVVAADDELRVFGVVVRQGFVWDARDGRYRYALFAIRLTQQDISRARSTVAPQLGSLIGKQPGTEAVEPTTDLGSHPMSAE